MKKVLGAIAGLVFGLFGIGVIGLVISLTYGALQKIFPDNPTNQMWGLVIFDIATVAWGLGFIFKSKSLGQYGAAGAGFLVGLLGTIAMIYAEVSLESAALTGNTDTLELGRWMARTFIIASIIHLVLLYMHHGADPELAGQISTGVARGQIIDKARHDAEKQLEAEAPILARDITADIVQSVRRDLQLPIPADPRMPFLPADPRRYELPYPIQEDATATDRPLPWSQRLRNWMNGFPKRQPTQPVSVENTNETWADRTGAIMAWRDTPTGRVRLWCLACREDGNSWATPEPCEHIQRAKQEEQIDTETALRTRDELLMEYARTEPSYHPVPMEPKSPEPSQ
jgi:hypothetical protein